MAKTSTRNSDYGQVEKYRNDTEAALLATIQENSQLPKKQQQQRYQQLWRKCEDEALSESENFLYIIGRTRTGRATVDALNMNRPEHVNRRKLLQFTREYPLT